MTEAYRFLWSLYPRCFVKIEKADGTPIEGYFVSLDRSTGAITVFEQQSPATAASGIGTRTLKSFRKFAVDRLGNRYEIEQETRTWHGAVCI
jgi:CRISPR-associated endonuclease Csn1